ncbi:MAG: autotransporter outer membrane beta-barrel domain-containing protein, partial [Xanthomonadales bacterium]|nr:autotransporter outer membrane beta-barrel domain-containing protein [Xanthomonadales bacterium]
MTRYLLVLGVALLALGASHQAPASGQSGMTRQVVVYRSGEVKSFALGVNARAATTSAACGSDIALQFQETARSSLPLSAPGTSSLDVDIVVLCRADDLSVATINYSSQVNPAGSLSVAPTQLANLMSGDAVTVSFMITASQSTNEDRSVTINREGGSYMGGQGAGLYFGSIPAAAAIASLSVPRSTFGNGELPTPPASGTVQPGTQQDLGLFCRAHPDDALCDALSDSGITAGEVATIIDTVSPHSTTALPTTVNQLSTTQLANVGARMADLIGGRGGGFSTSGLNLVDGTNVMPLGEIVASLSAAENENEERRTLMGGTRWGYWLNGNIGRGERDATVGNTGFTFDNFGLTSGVDYRIRDNLFAGMGLGYARLDSEYSANDGGLRGHAMALHGYGLYVWPNQLSLDASVSWSRGSFDQRRSMEAIRTLVGIPQGDAHGGTDTRQLSAALGLSWTYRTDTWTLMPQLQYEFIRANIDAFSETGCATGGGPNYCLIYP